MPFYRIGGHMCHLKLGGKLAKNPPAPCCARIPSIEGGKPEVRCMAISSLLCDHRLEDGGTCDAPLCADHATEVGPDRHLCRAHNLLRLLAAKDLFS